MKYDANKVVEALRCRAGDSKNCNDCPYGRNCDELLFRDAADLIESLKTELAAADSVISRLSSGRDGLVGRRVILHRNIGKPTGTILEVVDDRKTSLYHNVIVGTDGGYITECALYDVRLINEEVTGNG